MVNGAASEALIWDLTLTPGQSEQITWQSTVSSLQTGQIEPVASDATFQYVSAGVRATHFAGVGSGRIAEHTNRRDSGPGRRSGSAGSGERRVGRAQIGNTNLSNQFNDLAVALTSLVQNPTSAAFLSQAEAAISSIITQITNDPFLSSFTGGLSTAKSALASAVTASDIDTAISNLGMALNSLAQAITDEAAHGFTLALVDNLGVLQPGASTLYSVLMQNTGTATTTYDFSVSGLPVGVVAAFSQPSITLVAGQSIPSGTNFVTLSLSESRMTLFPASFSVIATAEGSPETTLSTPGQLTLRTEALLVSSVTTNPPFANAGTQVDVTAKISSVVNEPKQISVSYTVSDASNNLLFTSTPVSASLGITSTLNTLDLGSFDSTGFANGSDTITVTITDQSSQPLPSATGQATITIGLPVTSNLSVTPNTLPAGNGTVTNTLQFGTTINLPDPLTLDGQVQTTQTATTVALFQDATHNLAYVSGTSGIDIVDVSNPASPVDDGTFAGSLIVRGGLTVGRVDNIGGADYLLVGTTTTNSTGSVPPFTFLVFSLANPLSPTLVSETPFQYGFLSEMLVSGNTVLVPTDGFDLFGGLQDQFGTVMAIDVSNPAAPTESSVLFNSRGPTEGGNTTQFGGTIVNSQIAYIASSTATGGSTQDGVGQVLIVNYSDPTNLQLLGEVDIPNTFQVADVAIQGNEALVVGRTGGGSGTGIQGTMTLSLLNITNPSSPTLMGTTLVTNAQFATSGGLKNSAMSLGNGLFVVSEGVVNGNPQIVLVDPTNPNNIVVTYSPVTALVNEMAVSGNILYTTSSLGLTTYVIGSMESIPVTVSVEVPNNTGVSVVGNSFSTPPSQTITGTSFNTYFWNVNLVSAAPQATFTWNSTVSNLGAGEVLPVTLGATLNFVSQGTPGTLSDPATNVTGLPIISLIPGSQTARPGATVTYDVRLTNPTATQVTYRFGENGSFASVVINGNNTQTVAAGATVDVPIVITTSPTAALGTDSFQVGAASLTTGATEITQGTLILAGQPVVPVVSNPNAFGVAAALIPSQSTAGQGTSANYVVQVTNTGSTEETFSLAVAGLPSGVSATLGETSIEVSSGASNFLDVPLSLHVNGKTPGSYTFQVNVSDASSLATSTATGTLNIVSSGVTVAISPSSGAPGTTFKVVVTNLGTAQDTFDLSLGGPGAVVASLSTDKVTLAPGASSSAIPITTSAVNFAESGDLGLTVIATSETNSAVTNSATSNLVIPTTMAMSSNFSPSMEVLPVPGTTSFLLLVNNTGNLQDSYTATITSTNGPVTASLDGLDGQPTQTIPIFILPGLSTGAILLQTDLTSAGQGDVTVEVTSLTNDAITSSAIATVSSSALTAPTVSAPSSSSVNENGSLTFSGVIVISVTDAAGGGNDNETLTLSVSHGTLSLGTTTGLTVSGTGPVTSPLTLSGTLSALNGDLSTLVYTPTTGYSGPDTLSLSILDTTDEAQGAAAPVAITVNLVLNQPSVTNATTTDNTQTTSGLVITPNAADTAFVTNFQITNITGGTLYLNNGVTQVTNGEFITVAQGAAGLKFTPTSNSLTSGSFTVQESTSATTAGLGGPTATATITVNLVLNQPTVTNATTTDNTQTTSGLVITPNVADTAFVTNFQITNITGGTLYLNNGMTQVTDGEFITVAQGAAGLKFTPAANSLTSGSFTVQESTSATTAGLGRSDCHGHDHRQSRAAPAVGDQRHDDRQHADDLGPGDHAEFARYGLRDQLPDHEHHGRHAVPQRRSDPGHQRRVHHGGTGGGRTEVHSGDQFARDSAASRCRSRRAPRPPD